jgi:hydroxypyruvate reductase
VLAETVVRSGNVLKIHGDSYDLDRYDRVVVLGGGNAAGQIASYLADLLGDYLDDGVVVTDDPVSAGPVEVIEGTHPLPSRENVAGTERLLERARATGPDTLALVAISGGDSALLSAPADGISISELRELTDQLLQSGAAIDQINTVRKYVSNVKGGKLARELSQSDVVGLLFSDVSSNDPSVIASGPLSPDRSTFADAKAVVSELTMDPPTLWRAISVGAVRGTEPKRPAHRTRFSTRSRPTSSLMDSRRLLPPGKRVSNPV